MSLWVLDTDTVTPLRRGDANVTRQAAAHPPTEMAIAIVSRDEMLTGWYTLIRRAKDDAKLVRAYDGLRQIVEFCSRVLILDFDLPAAQRFHQLRSVNRRIGTNDLRIAAIVLEHGAILVSRNAADF
jgi:tRNA(fMet)-specific endonuclease VapC